MRTRRQIKRFVKTNPLMRIVEISRGLVVELMIPLVFFGSVDALQTGAANNLLSARAPVLSLGHDSFEGFSSSRRTR